MRGVFTCLQKIQTRRINRFGECQDDTDSLKMCTLPFGERLVIRLINIDASSLQGIQRGGVEYKSHDWTAETRRIIHYCFK